MKKLYMIRLVFQTVSGSTIFRSSQSSLELRVHLGYLIEAAETSNKNSDSDSNAGSLHLEFIGAALETSLDVRTICKEKQETRTAMKAK